jgi:hypothetical protein
MKQFVACVRGQAKPLVDLDAGIVALDVALRALKQIWS